MQNKYKGKNKGRKSCLTAPLSKFVLIPEQFTIRSVHIIAFLLTFFLLQGITSWAGDGISLTSSSRPLHIQNGKTSRLNVKVQPAIYWTTGGLEVEYVMSAKFSLALFGAYKLSGVDYTVKKPYQGQDYMNDGFMAELIARYYITLNKRNIGLAPLGFYVQGFLGYNHLLYSDGSVRPFSLNTRKRPSDAEGSSLDNFTFSNPIGGGAGAGYQVELLHNKVIANFTLGVQANSDNKGIFFTFFASPSIGMMF